MDAASLSAETDVWFDLGNAQRSVWFDVQLGAPRNSYLLGITGDVEAYVDEELARSATAILTARHEAFRLRVDDVLPRQRLVTAGQPPFVVVDVSNAPDPAAAFRAHVDDAIERGLAFGDAPLFRVDLVRRGPASTSVLLICHHAIVDAASLAIALGQWLAIYVSLASETVAELPPSSRFTPLVDADAAYARSPKHAEALAHGVKRFADPPEALYGPSNGTGIAARAEPRRFTIAGDAHARFVAACAKTGATVQGGLVALLAVTLGRRLHRTDVALGLALHRRDALNRGVVGMIAGVMPVRCGIDTNASFAQCVGRVGRTLDDDLRYHRLPIEDLVRELGRREPLFDVVLSFSPGAWDAGPLTLDGAPWRVASVRGAEMSALAVYVVERASNEALDLEVSFDPSRVSGEEATRIARLFERYVDAFARGPGTRVSRVDPLDDAERDRIEGSWRGTAASYPTGTLPGLIASQTARTPDAPAVVGVDGALTYAELGARADLLAARLAARGIGNDDVVGVYLPRSIASVVAALGIMRAGAAYLPLDPAYPLARLAFMARDAGAALVLDDATGDAWPETNRVALADLLRPREADEILAEPRAPDPASLAYVIYTSGSTGEPKGVAVSHVAPVNLAYARLDHDPLGPGDRVLAAISVGFDVSIGQLLLPLLVGATVVVAPELRTLAAHEFWAFLETHGVNHINSVPSFFESVLEAASPTAPLRRLMLGGERLTAALVHRLRAALPLVTVANMYGPTETCIDATVFVVPPSADVPADVPIGRPLPNYTAAILAGDEPVGIGVPGELCIGGAGLARGYLGKPELTAARFVADPLGAPGDRTYRTGDRACWREDGTIAFLGRIDAQVKIRGFRVEPGEVEAALSAHDDIASAAVIARDGRLYGYVVLRSGAAFDAVALRASLAERLPDYMVPTALAAIPVLPLTTNGKLDERALPDLRASATARAVEPRTPTERALARIVGDMLGSTGVGADSDFFALGGHSLLATQLVSRVRAELGATLPLRAIFTQPTIAGLAAQIDAAPDGARVVAVRKRDRPETLPLSFAQERFLLLDRLTAGNAYNVPLVFRIDGPFDVDAAERALRAIVARHEVLRSVIVLGDGEPSQTILPPDTFAPRRLSFDGRDERDLDAHLGAFATAPFDLTRELPIRAEIVSAGPARYALAVVAHHIAFDAWSGGILLGEFVAHYAAYAGDSDAVALPAVAWQYADVAVLQRAEDTDAGLDFWRSFLAGAPSLALPADVVSHGTDRAESVPVRVSAALHAALAARAREHGASLFMVLHAAFAILLARFTGERDVVIGTAVAGRSLDEWDATIGCFVNTVALRLDVVPGERFSDVLGRTRERDGEAFAHQDVPFERVARAVRTDRPDDALVRAMLVLQNTPMPPPELPGVAIAVVPLPAGGPKVDLALTLTPGADAGGMSGAFEYATALFAADTVAQLETGLQRLLEVVAAERDFDVDAVDLGALACRAPIARLAAPRPAEQRAYEAPQTPIEIAIADIFAGVLGLRDVGRNDDFFARGGHSLLAMTVVERMRRRDLHVDIRVLFATPTVAALAAAVDAREAPASVPERRIPPGCAAIVPAMLPLAHLTQDEIDAVVATVPGGAPNVLDIYPLAPLQEGILFRHVMEPVGDAYLTPFLLAFDTRDRLRRFVAALDELVARHDVLRTAFVWEGVSEPVQVVLRSATVRVEDVTLDAGDARERLRARFDPRSFRLDVREAPVLRAFVTHDAERDETLLLLMSHHLLLDHVSLALAMDEVRALALDARERLPAPVPYRNFVAQARLGRARDEHEAFFRATLGDVTEATIPFDVVDVRDGGAAIREARVRLPDELGARLRARARALGMSSGILVHAAWAIVLARLTDRDATVFGTVLLGRMQGGDDGHRVLGLTINTLPIRIETAHGSVEDLVRRTRVALGDLMRHEHASLALAQRCSGVAAPAPLFTSVFNYRFSPDEAEGARPPWPGVAFLGSEERTNYPLAMAVDDTGDGFSLTAQAEPPIDPERVCAYLETALRELLRAFDRSPDVPVRTLNVLPDAERLAVVEGFNRTSATFPTGTLHGLFAAQAAATPDAIAVVGERETLTYAALDARANGLAHALVARGVRPNDVVGVALARSPGTIVALFAALKAGAAYLPLDPAYPPERLAFTIADAAATLVVTETALHALLPAHVATIDVGDAGEASAPPAVSPDPERPAYVIYTSGSTGMPKGVVVPHAAAVNLAFARRAHDPIGAGDRILAAISVGFDVSIGQLALPLLAGATVVVAPDLRTLAPADFWAFVVRHGITHINSVPSYFDSVLEAAPRAVPLRRLMLGGEALTSALVRRLRDALPGTDVFNMYGPTEACIDATVARATDNGDDAVVPIGRPLPNYRAYVLDARREPVGIGVTGELFLAGAGLALGYLGRPELTAEKFVPDPFGAPGDRAYATGDRARFRPDGTIEFHGRADSQTKIRGHRVELGEIEARLSQLPGIREAVVVVTAAQRLIAYVTATGETAPVPDELRRALETVLPDYMVPGAIVVLERLPLTANGKLDRAALPVPDAIATSGPAYEAPQGEIERAIAQIWEDVLGVSAPSRHDDFFALGGHSLLAMTAIERMRRRDLHADVRVLFLSPTIAELAAAVDVAEAPVAVPPNLIPFGCEAIEPAMLPLVRLTQTEIDRIAAATPGGAANVADIYPLAPLQEGILFAHLATPHGDPYLTPFLLSFDRRGRLELFLKALDELIVRHDALRTAIVWEGVSEPVQVVLRHAPLRVEEIDVPANDAAERLRERFRPDRYRIDLREAPLLRAFVAHDAEADRHLLMLMSHHAILDHTSLEVAVGEVRAIVTDRREELRDPAPYRNFVAQSRLGRSQADHESFFRDLLGDVTDATAPYGVLAATGVDVGEAHLRLAPALADRIHAVARSLGTGAGTIFHAAWALVLGRLTAQRTVVFGTVVLGRMQGGSGSDRMLGLLINTLPVRFDLDAGTVGTFVRRVREVLAGVMRHEHAPLALAQRSSSVAAPAPLFSSLFNYRFSPEASGDGAAGWPGVDFLDTRERTNYPVSMAVDDTGVTFELMALAEAPVDPGRLCRALERAVTAFVAACELSPETALGDLAIDVMDPAERALVTGPWRGTRASVPEQTLPEAIAERAARAPEAIAVTGADGELTYAELDARSARIAAQLLARGVGPESVVGVYLPRSADAIVAALGIMRAGGVYLPLDPAYPQARLAFMIRDANASLVLHRARAPFPESNGVALDEILRDDAAVAADLGAAAPSPASLAYVIYTSGSTGKPKGVAMSHGAAVNLAYARASYDPLAPGDRVLAAASIGFDVSIGQLLLTLVAGATVVIAPDLRDVSPAEFWSFVRERRVNRFNSVPSVVESLLDGADAGPSLERLIVGGERLTGALVRRLRATFPGVSIVNVYGPTETCIDATAYVVPPGDVPDEIPIGRPLPNYTVAVLDADLRPVPAGVTGELFIGGAGLARGYVGRPELTAERFVADPLGAPGDRMYRTGDRARFDATGCLVFAGRVDAQVKVRGFRVEPMEIEIALVRHPQVAAAAVVARNGNLFAYVTSAGETAPDPHDLRAFVAHDLPDYMVPAAIVVLDALPVTTNGKLDYGALPEIRATDGGTAPRDHHEALLLTVWQDVLGVDGIGVDDDFFALGGHSLLALRLIAACGEAVGRSLPLQLLLESPTIAGMAAAVRAGAVGSSRKLVRLRRGDAAAALFCIHPAFGHAVGYASLAKAYPGDGAVFGIAASGLEPGESLGADVESMAASYLELVRGEVPHGPYRLLAFSSGGLVAFEMARQLAAAGETVATLALLDTSPPETGVARREITEIEVWFEMAGALGWNPASFPPGAFVSREALIAEAVERGLLAGELAVEHVRRMVTVRRNNVRVSVAYRPQPWHGRAVVVRSLNRVGSSPPDWSPLIDPAPATIDLDCAHDDLITAEMAEAVMSRLAPYFAP